MAKLVNHDLNDFENDYEAYFDKAFNNLIEIAILKLSTDCLLYTSDAADE